MSVIEDIFNGAILPSERVTATSQQYVEAQKNAKSLSQKLYNSMTPEQCELYDEYCSEVSLRTIEMYLAFFRYGMQLGARLERELNG